MTGGYADQCRIPGADPQIPDSSTSPQYVDRKLDLLVKELKRLGVAVAEVQETKWFGNDVWSVADYTLLLKMSSTR